jgi:hypothetical protein
MSTKPAGPVTKGVTVKLLETIDLGPEIEGMAGRVLRMRLVTMEPGSVFGPIHDHKDRPGVGLARGQEHPALARKQGNGPRGRDLGGYRQAGAGTGAGIIEP